MVEIKSLSDEEIRKLAQSVVEGLGEYGFTSEVELEPSGLEGRYRLYVVSDDFEKLIESERQDILWRILKERWSRIDQLRITLALALTRAEAPD